MILCQGRAVVLLGNARGGEMELTDGDVVGALVGGVVGDVDGAGGIPVLVRVGVGRCECTGVDGADGDGEGEGDTRCAGLGGFVVVVVTTPGRTRLGWRLPSCPSVWVATATTITAAAASAGAANRATGRFTTAA
jgi:hypothetical protein